MNPGKTAIKAISGIGSDRDYPWKEITCQGWLNNYSDAASLASALGATTGVHAHALNYDNQNYKTNFETWFGSVNTGVYIGLLYAGWVGMVIGYKQGGDGSFAILKYNLQNGFEKLVTIENGTFSWWTN